MKKILLSILVIAACICASFGQSTAEEWLKEAETAEAEGRWTDAGSARSNAANKQMDAGDFEAAAENYKKSAEHFEKDGRTAQAGVERTHAGNAYERAGDKAAEAGRHKDAADLYDKAAGQYEADGRTAMAENTRQKAEYERSLITAADSGNLQINATGTGRTTGHIATLSLYNPTNEAVVTDIGPYFIPSGGQYQPYIVPGEYAVTVPPHSTYNLPVNGYCADIFTQPVPAGAGMPPFDKWIRPGAGKLPQDWVPSPENGWQAAAENTTALIPGTDTPLHHHIDINKYPAEAATVLLDAVSRIGQAYDDVKRAGGITTPFSGNPEKEREAVIQQTFWIYTAELTGTPYKVEDFSKNTQKVYESNSGQKFKNATPAVQNDINRGVTDFWSSFEAVGATAKVLKSNPGTTEGPIEISVKDNYCECGDVTLTARVYLKDPFQPEVGCDALGLDSSSDTRDTTNHNVLPNYRVRLEITDLVAKCTECNNGQCLPENISVTVGSRGMADNKSETITAANGKYSMPARTVAALKDGEVAANNPVRLYITVKYDCAKADCKKKTCPERVFEVTIPRR